jgi:hypothetical protein
MWILETAFPKKEQFAGEENGRLSGKAVVVRLFQFIYVLFQQKDNVTFIAIKLPWGSFKYCFASSITLANSSL